MMMQIDRAISSNDIHQTLDTNIDFWHYNLIYLGARMIY